MCVCVCVCVCGVCGGLSEATEGGGKGGRPAARALLLLLSGFVGVTSGFAVFDEVLGVVEIGCDDLVVGVRLRILPIGL